MMGSGLASCVGMDWTGLTFKMLSMVREDLRNLPTRGLNITEYLERPIESGLLTHFSQQRLSMELKTLRCLRNYLTLTRLLRRKVMPGLIICGLMIRLRSPELSSGSNSMVTLLENYTSCPVMIKLLPKLWTSTAQSDLEQLLI